jgi:hypothetical protein
MITKTIPTKAERANETEDWSRLSDLKTVEAWGNRFFYYIDVSREGTSTRAVVVGCPASEVYHCGDREVQDFNHVSYMNPPLREEIIKKLRRQEDGVMFL